MEIILLSDAEENLKFWRSSGNKAVLKKISQLIESILETPYEGLGKPEPLKHHHTGKWSRRITDEHRMIYRIEDDKLYIFQLRHHY